MVHGPGELTKSRFLYPLLSTLLSGRKAQKFAFFTCSPGNSQAC